MPIPGYQEFMLPLLRIASDGSEHSAADAMESIADEFGISEADRDEMLPSGTQTRFYNRVTWALTYLSKSLLLEKTGRGRFRITERGRAVLSSTPARIDNAFLEQFAEYRQFKTKRAAKAAEWRSNGVEGETDQPDVTPDERLESAYRELRKTLADDLLDRIRSSTPRFFERLVVDLLVAMGYGGSNPGDAKVVGRSGDGGIDGVIKEDRLGLDMVYVQAKKWEAAVGPDAIRSFVGSLGEQRAHKGVFITSGSFTGGARTAAERANAKVVLIDGEQLTELMIDHGVGVADHKAYVVKKLDGDYFESL